METATTKWTRERSFVRGVVATFVLGLPGIVAVGASSIGELRTISQFADKPAPTLFFVGVAQPLVLLVFSCLVGTLLAPRVKLHSHVLSRIAGITQPPVLFAEEVPVAVGVGVATAFVVLVLDAAFTFFVPSLSYAIAASANDATVLSVLTSVPVRFLYGGITEELLLRYGFMTLLVWAGWKAIGGDRPSPRVVWSAIVVAAIVFGLGHLPAVAMSASLTPALVTRTVLLNALAGIGLGWLYWRGSLESAMVGHATFHVVAVIVSLALVA